MLLPRGPRDGHARSADEIHLPRTLGRPSHRLVDLACPRDAREVHDAAACVDEAPLVHRHQPHPRRPAAVLDGGAADGVAEPGGDDRVGVELQEQVSAGAGRGRVAGGHDAFVRGHLDERRVRGELPHSLDGPVSGVVVGDDQLVPVAELGDQRWEAPLDHLPLVVGHDEDGEGGPPLGAHGRRLYGSRRPPPEAPRRP